MKRFLKRYRGFTKCAAQEQLAYRKGVLTNGIFQLVGIFISIFLWRVLFEEQSTIQGYDWDQMILYALIVAMLNATLSFSTEMDLASGIRDGSIVSDLTKPVDFQVMSFFKALGQSIVEGGISILLISIVAIILTDMSSYLVPVRMVFL